MLLLLFLSGNHNEILSLVGLEAFKDILQHDLTHLVRHLVKKYTGEATKR